MIPTALAFCVKVFAAGGIGVALASAIAMVRDPAFPLTRLAVRAASGLDRDLRFIEAKTTGAQILLCQVVVAALAITGGIMTEQKPFIAVFLLAVFAPKFVLAKKRAGKIAAIDGQVDGFLIGFANALKAVPNASAGLLIVSSALQEPMRSEIERVLKEMRIGSGLDRALLALSARIGSRTLDDALTSILIGIQVGGDLPSLLTSTAAALREMARLDGVVRSKTAEGKAQLWLLALVPFLLIVVFNALQPGFFAPLSSSLTGIVVTSMAVAAWVGAITLARSVLSVDV